VFWAGLVVGRELEGVAPGVSAWHYGERKVRTRLLAAAAAATVIWVVGVRVMQTSCVG
jgi:hypothetical protein